MEEDKVFRYQGNAVWRFISDLQREEKACYRGAEQIEMESRHYRVADVWQTGAAQDQ